MRIPVFVFSKPAGVFLSVLFIGAVSLLFFFGFRVENGTCFGGRLSKAGKNEIQNSKEVCRYAENLSAQENPSGEETWLPFQNVHKKWP